MAGRPLRSTWIALLVLPGLVGLGGPLRAEDAARPSEGAERAIAAHHAGDSDALARVARSEFGDVWTIVDRLLARGQPDVAEAVAQLTPDDRLKQYLDTYAKQPPPPGIWERLDHIEARRAARDLPGARAALTSAESPAHGVSAVRYALLQVFLLEKREAARAAGQQAITEARALGWPRGLATALRVNVNLAAHTRDPSGVLQHGRDLLELLVVHPDQALELFAHLRLAIACHRLKRVAEARAHATAAQALAHTTRERRDALRTLITVSGEGLDQRTLRTHLLELHRLETALEDAHGTAATEVRLAAAEAHLGRMSSAVARLDRAFTFFEAQGTPWQRRGAHQSAAFVALEALDAERALHHVAAARKAGAQRNWDETGLLAVEAAARYHRGEFTEAEQIYEQLLARPQSGAKRTRVATWLNLAEVQVRNAHPQKAGESLRAARAALGEEVGTELHARLLTTRCLLHLATGEVEAALAAAREAHAIAKRLLLPRLTGLIEKRLAESFLHRGKWSEALGHAERAVASILERSAALPERVGAQYRAELSSTFSLAVEAAFRAKAPARFFLAAEQARAVALRHRLGGSQTAIDVLSPELRERAGHLGEEEAQIVARYRSALRAGDTAAAQKELRALEGARERLARFRDRIHASNAAIAHLVDPLPSTLEEVQAATPPKAAQVFYAHGLRQVIAMVVTRNSTRWVTVGTPEALGEIVEALAIEDPSAPWRPAWQALQARIIEPLQIAPEVTHLTIVPTGQLTHIPFAALWPAKQVTHLPSATVGALLDERQDTPGVGVLAIGDPDMGGASPLPGAAREAEGVGDTVLTGEASNEGAIRRALALRPRWRVVHFACHALLDPVHPLRSSLAVAPAEGEDGFFTVAEILETPVPSELVVIAACSSSQGRSFEQEGRIGFVHAFFVAGGTRVLASLWDVDDQATRVFMQEFHRRLAAGAAPALALQQTQTWMKAQAAWAHPAHWAAWQLWGPRAR